MRHRQVFLTLLLAMLAVPDLAESQIEISSRASSIQVGGRAHAQYAASSVGDADNDFFLRRVRLIADITLNDFVTARVQPDFARGKIALQDVYVRLGSSSKFRVWVGQFKRSTSLNYRAQPTFQSSNEMLVLKGSRNVLGYPAYALTHGLQRN